MAGGIVTGQSLIHTAQLRNQAKQITDYQIAFNTFITKYNCVPGDCANATTFFGTSVHNGNGNGSIDTASGLCYDDAGPCGFDLWSASTEMQGAFQQLSLANMISFSPGNTVSDVIGISHPATTLNANAGFFFGANYNFNVGFRNPWISAYQNGTNAMWFVHCNGTSDTIGQWDNNCAIFTAADLQAIDQKIDDGTPLGGKLFGFGGAPSINDCLNINGSASTYKTTNTTPQCQAAFIVN